VNFYWRLFSGNHVENVEYKDLKKFFMHLKDNKAKKNNHAHILLSVSDQETKIVDVVVVIQYRLRG
jgi:hypothetical protein